jgi:hypothetical protein
VGSPNVANAESRGAATAPFDPNAAQQALANINLQSCATSDGPTGAGHAMVMFGPSGNVVSAVLDDGPFGGTRVGACVTAKYARARVPAFRGEAVAFGKGFSIRAPASDASCKGDGRFDPISGKVRSECVGK